MGGHCFTPHSPPPRVSMADAVDEVARVREELRTRGFAICRGILPMTAIDRARRHLEGKVDKHLANAVAAGTIKDPCEGLPLEERMAVAYRECPEAAPCSWVPETRTAFAFQQVMPTSRRLHGASPCACLMRPGPACMPHRSYSSATLDFASSSAPSPMGGLRRSHHASTAAANSLMRPERASLGIKTTRSSGCSIY